MSQTGKSFNIISYSRLCKHLTSQWHICINVNQYGEIFSVYVLGHVITTIGKELIPEAIKNHNDFNFFEAFKEVNNFLQMMFINIKIVYSQETFLFACLFY